MGDRQCESYPYCGKYSRKTLASVLSHQLDKMEILLSPLSPLFSFFCLLVRWALKWPSQTVFLLLFFRVFLFIIIFEIEDLGLCFFSLEEESTCDYDCSPILSRQTQKEKIKNTCMLSNSK